jgi:hypothetical protein
MDDVYILTANAFRSKSRDCQEGDGSWKVGSKVEALWRGRVYQSGRQVTTEIEFPGVIMQKNRKPSTKADDDQVLEDTYHVRFDDGDHLYDVPASHIHRRDVRDDLRTLSACLRAQGCADIGRSQTPAC